MKNDLCHSNDPPELRTDINVLEVADFCEWQ
jgi:hypothetical protein